jgi:hypothetical protein
MYTSTWDEPAVSIFKTEVKLETASSSGTVVTSNQTAQYHNQEDHNLNLHCHENHLIPYNILSTNND